jgi:hypothetical protein
LADLLVDERFEAVGQGDVHRAHGASLGSLAKFGNKLFITESILGIAILF